MHLSPNYKKQWPNIKGMLMNLSHVGLDFLRFVKEQLIFVHSGNVQNLPVPSVYLSTKLLEVGIM